MTKRPTAAGVDTASRCRRLVSAAHQTIQHGPQACHFFLGLLARCFCLEASFSLTQPGHLGLTSGLFSLLPCRFGL